MYVAPSSATISASPDANSLSDASLKAPTPGSIIFSDYFNTLGSLVTTVSAPTYASELFKEKRFPTP